MTESQGSPPNISPTRFIGNALKYGLISGVIGGIWMIAEYALGFQTERPEIGKWTGIAAMVIPIAAVVLGMTAWRNDGLGGRIRFSQAFGMALAIGLVFSACMGCAAWLQVTRFAPDLLEYRVQQRAAIEAQQPDANPDAIAKKMEADLKSATPAKYGQFIFSFFLVQSLFVGLIASITVPKKRPGLD